MRILRSESACALPRPSATASAKLANTTVIHNQTLIQAVNHSGAAPAGLAIKSRTTVSVVSTLPTSTTNITGLCATAAGESLRRLSQTACRMMVRSNSEGALLCDFIRTTSRARPGNARPRGRGRERGKTLARRQSESPR